MRLWPISRHRSAGNPHRTCRHQVDAVLETAKEKYREPVMNGPLEPL
jgi:hypothetical protein